MQTAIITGAAGGIGSAIARVFVEHHASQGVVLIDHPSAKSALVTLREELANFTRVLHGSFAKLIEMKTLDVTDPEAIQHVIDDLVSDGATINTLVNAAGIMPKEAIKPEAKVGTQDNPVMHHVVEVNQWGTKHCCEAVLPHMRKAKYGRIVNIASVVGLKGDTGNATYAMSKAAVISYTQSCCGGAPYNKNKDEPALDITVNAIAPGIVETQMTDWLPDASVDSYMQRNPQRRKMQPVEVAYPVLWLASKEASGISGACLPVDGGYLVS